MAVTAKPRINALTISRTALDFVESDGVPDFETRLVPTQKRTWSARTDKTTAATMDMAKSVGIIAHERTDAHRLHAAIVHGADAGAHPRAADQEAAGADGRAAPRCMRATAAARTAGATESAVGTIS